MSHIVTIQAELRDPAAIRAACERLRWPPPAQGEATLFSGKASGWLVRPPGWLYPVVIDERTGQARYDNYGGAWGEQAHLDRLLQLYAVEKARIEAHRRGHSVTEQALPDGSIRVSISVGGAS